MRTIQFSKSTLRISQIGFGCARLGSGIEFSLSSGLIECALDHGIRHFDTAPMYGSESLLGDIFGDSKKITIEFIHIHPPFKPKPISGHFSCIQKIRSLR